jgi:hypothetical protein
MNLLQIPIMDKYFVSPMDPSYRTRGTAYAEAKGLLSPTERRFRAEPRPLVIDAQPAEAGAVGESLTSAPLVPPESAIGTVH